MKRLGLGLLVGCGVATLAAGAQQIGSLDAPPVKSKQFVQYAAEEQTLHAGKPDVLELHFQVLDGFHVNSHTPNSDLLIATRMELQPAAGVKPGAVEYPAGHPYSFSSNTKEMLDVYSGGFTVRLLVTAVAGEHEVDGTLRYQACDHAACYPPKALPVHVLFTAK